MFISSKKTRAVLGSNNIGKLMQEYTISAEKVFILPSAQSDATPFLILPPMNNGFYPLFSGLSPPSLYINFLNKKSKRLVGC